MILDTQAVPQQVRSLRERPRIVASWLHAAFAAFALALGFINIVFPNSLRPASFYIFAIAALLALLATKKWVVNARLLIWLMGSIVTLFYVAVGWYQRPTEAVWQVPFVYVLSPGLWLLVCSRVMGDYPASTVIRIVLFYGFLGAISVFGFFFVFLTMGPDAVRWMIRLPNVEFGSGTAAATMYVFGSLMFVCGGFFAAPQMVRSTLNKVVLAVVLMLAAVLSGRVALMLSIAFGGLVYMLSIASHGDSKAKFRRIFTLFAMLVVAALAILWAAERFGFDVSRILTGIVQKVSSGGGDERGAQFVSLVKGIKATWGLGAGHGIGVSVIRSEEFPWRYELLWLATVYRVGFLGALIYALPVIIIFIRYGAMLANRRNSAESDFMFGGFFAAFLGAATNPYYESFEFQWMLFLPFVYFTLTKYVQPRAAPERQAAIDGAQGAVLRAATP